MPAQKPEGSKLGREVEVNLGTLTYSLELRVDRLFFGGFLWGVKKEGGLSLLTYTPIPTLLFGGAYYTYSTISPPQKKPILNVKAPYIRGCRGSGTRGVRMGRDALVCPNCIFIG